MTIAASLLRFAKGNDPLTLPGAILSTALILGATIIGWKKYTKIGNDSITTASSSTGGGSDDSKERNNQARKRAAEAAAQRYRVTRSNPKVNKKKLKYHHLPPPPYRAPAASISPLIDQPTQPDTPIPMPVFDDGITCFRHIPHLLYADSAAATLKQIALEFMPIIRQRGYDIRTVSEFCCCGDGLDYQLGGQKFCVRRRGDIAGHGGSSAEVAGYNLLERSRGIQTVHSIHVRLRSPNNHELLIPYEQVVFTMAHELAHCIHRHHKWQFHALMQELLEQHACSVKYSSVA
jgi:hypothetical protein